jgi:hypothetical protein
MFPVLASRCVSLEMFSWLERFWREWTGGGASLLCCGGGVVGACELAGGGCPCSPEIGRLLFVKLGWLLLGSLLPYAESKLVSMVSLFGLCSFGSVAMALSRLVLSLSFSLEWKTLDNRNLDFFLSSADAALVEGAMGCEMFAGWPLRPPDIARS